MNVRGLLLAMVGELCGETTPRRRHGQDLHLGQPATEDPRLPASCALKQLPTLAGCALMIPIVHVDEVVRTVPTDPAPRALLHQKIQHADHLDPVRPHKIACATAATWERV